MIYSIRGKIVHLSEDVVCIEQHDIAWEIHISKNSYIQFSDAQGTALEAVKVYTYMHANDKGILLYGFHSLAERSVFLTLMKVDGIGPKAAIKILSNSTPDLLISHIKLQDPQALAKIPGIGTKKASKILLTLEGVYVSTHNASAGSQETHAHSQEYNVLSSTEKDIVDGLVKMGYKIDEVLKVLVQYKEQHVSTETASIIDEGTLMRYIITALEQ